MSTHPGSQAEPVGGDSLQADRVPVDPALADAMRALLGPIARLALAQGVPCGALEEMLKEAFVDEALKAQPVQTHSRMVSRLSVATGINRREVTRLTRQQRAVRPVRPSPASELFTRWMTDPAWCEGAGDPKPLPRVPRVAGEPSFEALAQSVTRDVHPRSLLDELLRLKLAALDEDSDTVALLRDGFVPAGDRTRLLGFLSDNVGDHLAAAVDNVLADGRRHFEQAVFADGLSEASMQRVHMLVGPLWRTLLDALVPPLEQMVEADAELPAAERRRVRIGLYAYDDATPEAKRAAAPPPAAPTPKRRVRKA